MDLFRISADKYSMREEFKNKKEWRYVNAFFFFVALAIIACAFYYDNTMQKKRRSVSDTAAHEETIILEEEKDVEESPSAYPLEYKFRPTTK